MIQGGRFWVFILKLHPESWVNTLQPSFTCFYRKICSVWRVPHTQPDPIFVGNTQFVANQANVAITFVIGGKSSIVPSERFWDLTQEEANVPL